MDSNCRGSFESASRRTPDSRMFETPRKRGEPVKVLNTFILDFPRTSFSEKKERPSVRRNNSSTKASSRRSFKKGKSMGKDSVIEYKTVENFDFELKKLLRAVFRHCVACPEFKSELVSIEATKLLDLYAKNRTMK